MTKTMGKNKGKTSNGQRHNVSTKTSNAIRANYMQSCDRLINQMNALHAGKDIRILVPVAPKDGEKASKNFVSVHVSGKEYIQRLKALHKPTKFEEIS